MHASTTKIKMTASEVPFATVKLIIIGKQITVIKLKIKFKIFY